MADSPDFSSLTYQDPTDIFSSDLSVPYSPDFSYSSPMNVNPSGYAVPLSAPVTAPASSGFKMPTTSQDISALTDVMGGVGSYMQGQETAKADEYNAQLALTQGQFNVEQLGEQESEVLSTQKAMYAKAGVEQSGSVLDTAVSTATQFEYSKQVAQYNAQSAANEYNYEAKVAKQQGEFGLFSGLLEGGATLALALM